MTKILLGETRREAISRVQELLGPATSRPLAEQTFWALAKRGKITMDQNDGTYLIEADIPDEQIKDVATQVNTTMERSKGIHYQVNRNHFHRARVAWQWKSKIASVMSPSLPSLDSPTMNPPDPNAPAPDDPTSTD